MEKFRLKISLRKIFGFIKFLLKNFWLETFLFFSNKKYLIQILSFMTMFSFKIKI